MTTDLLTEIKELRERWVEASTISYFDWCDLDEIVRDEIVRAEEARIAEARKESLRVSPLADEEKGPIPE